MHLRVVQGRLSPDDPSARSRISGGLEEEPWRLCSIFRNGGRPALLPLSSSLHGVSARRGTPFGNYTSLTSI